MTPEQKAAFANSLSPTFTEEEATLVLDWYGVPSWGSAVSVGVLAAVKKLGGTTYNSGMGCYPVNYKGIHDEKFRPFGVFKPTAEQQLEYFEKMRKRYGRQA